MTTIHSTKEEAPVNNRLATSGFVSGILALLAPVITAWEAIVPSIPGTVELHFGHIPFLILFYFSLFGSIPFGIASLVTGWLALLRGQKSKGKPRKTWAILAIVFGVIGLIYSAIILIGWIRLRHTPVTHLISI